MYTVMQAARSANVSGTTIRNWSRMYADYLSPSANPSAGTPREYTPEDLAVFSTIAVLRDQLQETEAIRAALDEGQRLEPLHPPPVDQILGKRGHAAAQADADQAATDQAAAAAAASAATAIDIYRDRVNQLEARADHLADRLIDAEARAAAAERELEVMRALYEAATSPTPADQRPTFWQWLTRGRK